MHQSQLSMNMDLKDLCSCITAKTLMKWCEQITIINALIKNMISQPADVILPFVCKRKKKKIHACTFELRKTNSHKSSFWVFNKVFAAVEIFCGTNSEVSQSLRDGHTWFLPVYATLKSLLQTTSYKHDPVFTPEVTSQSTNAHI